MNEVQVPIIGRQQCDLWLDNLTVSEGMICAGYEEGGKDACQVQLTNMKINNVLKEKFSKEIF